MGLGIGIVASVIFGVLLFGISNWIGTSSDNLGKLWEALASFLALILITTFIVFMIKHKDTISQEIRDKMKVNLSVVGIIALAATMVAREGAEVALFAFASTEQGSYLFGAFVGIALSAVLAVLIYKSLIKVNLKTIFNITLFYLILQAGFMLGYSIHEFLSFLKAEEFLSSSSFIYTKLFDLSDTVFYHKEGILGVPLYILIGWYSKPEIVQFLAQYIYTGSLLYVFFRANKKALK
jgi:high-affinity iron transporter